MLPSAMPKRLRRTPSSGRGAAREAQSAKALQRKPVDIVTSRGFGEEICKDFPDHRRELEPVAGAWRSDQHVWMARHAVDNEIAVRCNRIKAAGRGGPAPVRVREVVDEGCTDQVLVGDRDCAVAGLGIDGFVAMVMLGDFDEPIAVE